MSSDSATTDPAALESQFAIVFAKASEAADKLHLGKTKTALVCASEFVLVQVSMVPLVLSVVAAPDANVGMILHLLPALQRVLDPVRAAADDGAT